MAAEYLILACHSLFCVCIVVALLNVYWKELPMLWKKIVCLWEGICRVVSFPFRGLYHFLRYFFKVDTPAEREWSLIKASVISALLIAGYLWWLSTHSTFVSQFPGTLVITVIAIPVAWILWIWRNQDKRETLNNERTNIDQAEKELGWKEDDRLWNNFFERQKIADDKLVPENVRITALYALESYLKRDDKTCFSELTQHFLYNILKNAEEYYLKNFYNFLWGIEPMEYGIATRVIQTASKLLYWANLDSLLMKNKDILYPRLIACNQKLLSNFSRGWFPYSSFTNVSFCGNWRMTNLSFCDIIGCSFNSRTVLNYANFTSTFLVSTNAIDTEFKNCNFLNTTLGGKFQYCSFSGSLFVGTKDQGININECFFNNCIFINSLEILAVAIKSIGINSSDKIYILQFPRFFIQKYIIEKEKLASTHPYLILYNIVWDRYLYSSSNVEIDFPEYAIDLYFKYKEGRTNGTGDDLKKWYNSQGISTNEDKSDFLFSFLFHYKKNQFPYLNELLEMASRFEDENFFDWSILDRAYDAKKAELEPEPVKSTAE